MLSLARWFSRLALVIAQTFANSLSRMEQALLTRSWPKLITFVPRLLAAFANEVVRLFEQQLAMLVPRSTQAINGIQPSLRRYSPTLSFLLLCTSKGAYPMCATVWSFALLPFRVVRALLWRQRQTAGSSLACVQTAPVPLKQEPLEAGSDPLLAQHLPQQTLSTHPAHVGPITDFVEDAHQSEPSILEPADEDEEVQLERFIDGLEAKKDPLEALIDALQPNSKETTASPSKAPIIPACSIVEAPAENPSVDALDGLAKVSLVKTDEDAAVVPSSIPPLACEIPGSSLQQRFDYLASSDLDKTNDSSVCHIPNSTQTTKSPESASHDPEIPVDDRNEEALRTPYESVSAQSQSAETDQHQSLSQSTVGLNESSIGTVGLLRDFRKSLLPDSMLHTLPIRSLASNIASETNELSSVLPIAADEPKHTEQPSSDPAPRPSSESLVNHPTSVTADELPQFGVLSREQHGVGLREVSTRSTAPSVTTFTTNVTSVGGVMYRTSLMRQLKAIRSFAHFIVQPTTLPTLSCGDDLAEDEAIRLLARWLPLQLPYYQRYCGAFLKFKDHAEELDAGASLERERELIIQGDYAPEALPFPRWCSRLWMTLMNESVADSNTRAADGGMFPDFVKDSELRLAFARMLAVVLSLPSAGLLGGPVSNPLDKADRKPFTRFIRFRVLSCPDCGLATLDLSRANPSYVATLEGNQEAQRRLHLAQLALDHAMIATLQALSRRAIVRAKSFGSLDSESRSPFYAQVRRSILARMTPDMARLALGHRPLPDLCGKPPMLDAYDDYLYEDPSDSTHYSKLRREIAQTIVSFSAGFGSVFTPHHENKESVLPESSLPGAILQTCGACHISRWPLRRAIVLHESPTLDAQDGDTSAMNTSTDDLGHVESTARGSATILETLRTSSNAIHLSSHRDDTARTPVRPQLSKATTTAGPDPTGVNRSQSPSGDHQSSTSSRSPRPSLYPPEEELISSGLSFWEVVDYFASVLHINTQPSWTVEVALLDALHYLRMQQELASRARFKPIQEEL